MRRFGWVALALILLTLVAASTAQAEKRIALVIGNGAYVNVPRLPNPTNDAAAMAGLLRKAGFDVVEEKANLRADALRRVLRDFSEHVRDADIAVVFYAGHGMEMNGVNYLIPVDATLARDVDVEDEAVSLDRVIRTSNRPAGFNWSSSTPAETIHSSARCDARSSAGRCAAATAISTRKHCRPTP